MNEPASKNRFHDLGTRSLSGAGLALLALLAFWAGSPWSTLLLAVGAAVMLWEYHRMIVGGTAGSIAPLVTAGLGAGTIVLHDYTGLLVSLPILLGASVVILVSFPRNRLWMSVGYAYIVLAMAALVSLRGAASGGFELVLWLILVVVAADVGGYFFGRYIGGPKLWPAVSPKKTWSGAAGGWLLAVLSGIGFAVVIGAAVLPVALYSLAIAVVSQAGDILESVVKRRFSVKDTGQILPGHGGALDRLDGLMAAALFSAAFGLRPESFQV